MASIKEKIDFTRLPRHVAIIMDGNRRWAKEKGENTFIGHQNGVESVRAVTKAAAKLGVEYLTLYAFSTENWNRTSIEVDFLMQLLVESIEHETAELHKNNVRILIIGDLERLSEELQTKIQYSIDLTAKNTGLALVVALNYSSRSEITNAVKNIARSAKNNEVKIEDIDENTVREYLYTKNIPDPELLIRTSNELRLSNFLLWQAAYSELYFTEVYWPDFGEEHFYTAVYEYQLRDRRFGK